MGREVHEMRTRAKILAVVLAGCVAFTAFPVSPVQAAGSIQQNAAVEATQRGAEAKTSITGLTTNYQTNPLGIEAAGIRFGWQMDSNVIGARQSSYQVKVFAEDGAQVWDSGKVESDKSTGIACGGTISERGTYRWEVTVWDQAGQVYTAESSFETGVSNVQEWRDAEFICMNRT